MAEVTLASLLNRIRKLEEEIYVLRNCALPQSQASSHKSGMTPYTGWNDGGGGYGIAEDLFMSSNWGKKDEDGEPLEKDKLCIKAIDGKVIAKSGDVGDLWQFVVETSPDEDGNTRKISVSGWAW